MNTRIKELRNYLKLTQKEFGLKLGLKSSISEIENRKCPHYWKNYYYNLPNL